MIKNAAGVRRKPKPAAKHNTETTNVMPKQKSIIGKKFARLTVIGEAKPRRYLCGTIRRRSIALCDCGKVIETDNTFLMLEKTRSCGCLRRELLSNQEKTHGHTVGYPTRTYFSWRAIIERCTNTNNKQWKDYGGRGIQICKQWMSFESFLSDMGERPKGTTIDRIDNDGNYCSENCRWISRREQQRNKRTNRIVTFKGVTGCLVEMCERFSVPYGLVRQRLSGYGWSVEDAFARPNQKAQQP